MGFFSDFMGKSAKKDLREADAKSKAYLNAGKDEADSRYVEGWDTARGYIDPYAEGGRAGQTMYENTLGLNGEGARDEAQRLYYSDPNEQRIGDLVNKRIGYKYNAGGSYGTGAHNLASSRAALEQYGGWQNRLGELGARGQQAATTGATLGYQAGSDRASLAYGHAQQQAGREQSFGNAMAANRMTGINNILATAGTVAKFFMPSGGSMKTGSGGSSGGQ